MIRSAFSYLSQASNQIFQANSADGKSHPLVGQTLTIAGRQYAVRSLLAEGGFALVFTVQDVLDGKWYALKRQLAIDQQSSDAVVKEVKFLKQLSNHPTIVRFCHATQLSPDKQSGQTHFAEFLVLTELCSGGPLISLMQKGPLTPDQVLRIFYSTAQAVMHMHDRNPPITHRDIKIENLLFDANGYLKLCDFGSATTDIYRPDDEWNVLMRSQLEEEMAKHTTPMYRAPEILDTYQNYPIGPAQDIWALGCVLFYLCYRVHPFEDSAKLRILNAKYTLPAESAYQIFHDLIRITLQPDPYSRPSIQDLCDQVEQVAMALDVDLNEPIVSPDQLESIIPKGYSRSSTPSESSQSTSTNKSFSNASQSVNLLASQLRDQGLTILKNLKSSAISEQIRNQLGSDRQPPVPSETSQQSSSVGKTAPPRPPPPPTEHKTLIEQKSFGRENNEDILLHDRKKDSNEPTNDFFSTLNWNSVVELQQNEKLGHFIPQRQTPSPASENIQQRKTPSPAKNKHENLDAFGFLDDSLIPQQQQQQRPNSSKNDSDTIIKHRNIFELNEMSEAKHATSHSGTDLLNLLDAELATSSAAQMHRNASTPNFVGKNEPTSSQKIDNFLEEFLTMKQGDVGGSQEKSMEQKPNYSRQNFVDKQQTEVPKKSLNKDAFTFDDLLSAQGFISSTKHSNMTLADLTREQEIMHMDPVSITIRDWTSGKERNIRALLGSLSNILWDEARTTWNQPTVADLFDADNIKRYYRRACLVVHPDKQSGTPHELLAKAIFTELNDAWTEFQKNHN